MVASEKCVDVLSSEQLSSILKLKMVLDSYKVQVDYVGIKSNKSELRVISALMKISCSILVM